MFLYEPLFFHWFCTSVKCACLSENAPIWAVLFIGKLGNKPWKGMLKQSEFDPHRHERPVGILVGNITSQMNQKIWQYQLKSGTNCLNSKIYEVLQIYILRSKV